MRNDEKERDKVYITSYGREYCLWYNGRVLYIPKNQNMRMQYQLQALREEEKNEGDLSKVQKVQKGVYTKQKQDKEILLI